MITTLGLGVYWTIKDQDSELENSNKSSSSPSERMGEKFLKFAIPSAMGAIFALMVAFAEIDIQNYTGISFSNLGIPYYIPIGAIGFGVMAAHGCAIGLGLVGRRPESIDLYIMVAVAILAFLLIKSAAFYGIGSRGDVKSLQIRFELPPPQITLTLQAVGFGIGGLIAFLLARPASKPWSRS